MANIKKNAVAGEGFVVVKVHKNTTINLFNAERIKEAVEANQTCNYQIVNITEKPVLDGCTIRIRTRNGKIARFEIWYEGSEEYIRNEKYDAYSDEQKLDHSQYKLNKKAKTMPEEFAHYETLKEAINALAEFAPDW